MKPYDAILENHDENIEQTLSKTKRKLQMDERQILGQSLVELSKNQLAKFDLSVTLLDAIKLAHKITANGAIRRHRQYIGKLMRDVDIDYIKDKLEQANNESAKSTKLLHITENWRERLVVNDEELQKFINLYPHCNVADLRGLIRASRREMVTGQTKNQRKLYQLIRGTIDGVNI